MFYWSLVITSRHLLMCVRGQSPHVLTALPSVSLKLSVPDFHSKRTNIKEGKLFLFFLLEILFKILNTSLSFLNLLYIYSFLNFSVSLHSHFSLSFASSLHMLNLYLEGDWYSCMGIAFFIGYLETVHIFPYLPGVLFDEKWHYQASWLPSIIAPINI